MRLGEPRRSPHAGSERRRPWRTGGILHPDWFVGRVWRPLQARPGLRHRTPHQARHAFATLLLQQGESLDYVKVQLGHSSIRATADTYVHWLPGSNRGAVDRLDAAEPATVRNPRATETGERHVTAHPAEGADHSTGWQCAGQMEPRGMQDAVEHGTIRNDRCAVARSGTSLERARQRSPGIYTSGPCPGTKRKGRPDSAGPFRSSGWVRLRAQGERPYGQSASVAVKVIFPLAGS